LESEQIMKVLRGKTAILTGGSYGIGPYIGRALAREGVNLALAARSADKLEKVANEIEVLGVKVVALPTDLRDPLAREALVTRTEAELGPVDILINNASTHHTGRLHTRSLEQIEAVIQTNLIAPIMLTRRLLPDMLRRGQGHIVHVGSLAGKAGIPHLALYDASKYGLTGFNHCLQAELHGSGVHSSAVCSGYVAREGMWFRFNRKVHPAFGLSSPERVARAVLDVIKKNKVEVIVNPLPVRPVILLWALWPDLATRVFRLLQVNKFMEGVALQHEADEVMLTSEYVVSA
jgi:short-subunit dehydrogenase